jgi:ABC-type phosphate transport system substrate-binding protein
MKATTFKLIFLAILLTHVSYAQEYAVIASKNVKELSLGELRAIFLKKISYVDDIKVLPINLGSRDEIRKSFEKNVLHMKLSKLKSYWTKQHYLGHRPPITMKSQNTVKAFVKKVDGAIGYINIQSVDESVKVIYRWRDE